MFEDTLNDYLKAYNPTYYTQARLNKLTENDKAMAVRSIEPDHFLNDMGLTLELARFDAEQIVADHGGGGGGSGSSFNVKDYGAIGNGSTDDTSSIAATYTAARSVAGTVVFPPGTYINGISINPTGTTTMGYGATLKHKASQVAKDMFHSSSSGANFFGLTIDMNKANTTDPGVNTEGNGIYLYDVTALSPSIIRDVTIINSFYCGVRLGTGASGLTDGKDLPYVNNKVLLDNVRISGCQYGVFLLYVGGVEIRGGSVIGATDGYWTHMTNNLVVDGTVANNNARHGIIVAYGAGARIANNRCNNNNNSGIVMGGGDDTLMQNKNFTVTGNVCEFNGEHGITSDPTKYGSLTTMLPTYGAVTGNVCSGNIKHGIYLQSPQYMSITGNVCQSNTYSGISCTASRCSISGNTLTGNGWYGLSLFGNASAPNTGEYNVGVNIVKGNTLGQQYVESTYVKDVVFDPIAYNVKDYGAVGDGTTDDTVSIQSAVNAAATVGGRVYVPPGTYMIRGNVPGTATSNYLLDEGGVELKSNIHFDMAPKAVLKAFSTLQNQYVILRCYNKTNIRITGGIVQGERSGHIGSTGEWGYGLAITGGSNITVEHTQFIDCWGDGVNVQVLNGTPNVPAKDVYLNNIICNNNRRQGMSVEGVDGLLVVGSTFTNTSGTLPQCGVIIEPWDAANIVRNIEFRSCLFSGNAGGEFATTVGRTENLLLDSNRFITVSPLADSVSLTLTSEVTLRNNLFDSRTTYNTSSLLRIYACDDIRIDRNHFINSPRSMWIDESTRIQILNNVSDNAGISAAQIGNSSNIRIEGNLIYGACHQNSGEPVIYCAGTVSKVRILNNTFDQGHRSYLTTSNMGSGWAGLAFRSAAGTALDTVSSGNIMVSDGVHAFPFYGGADQALTSGYIGEGKGGLMVVATTQRPSAPVAGTSVYDTTLSKPIWYNGTVWKDAAGTTV